RLVALAQLAVETGPRGDVELAAEDRMDPVPAGRFVELDRPEEVAVVGERHRRHAQLAGAREERIDLDRTVEERVLAVEVQVDEGPRAPAPTPTRWSRAASTRRRRRPGSRPSPRC